MRPDPSIVARLLALPIEVRVRLWEASEPDSLGWGVWADGPTIRANYRPRGLPTQGYAWYPADSAAWMLAAAGERLWMLHRGGAMITGQEDSYPTAEECALSWFEAGN